ncbi:outer membrane protein assembly factor BamB family protein [Halomicrococcus gelatinilyticus]|uniref:outer membrane protein assembly factor BamB family protein n=1 Tax=Halomicrococcus gelatinilyticus TaxID=1702103 RepID=UPI002E14C8C6
MSRTSRRTFLRSTAGALALSGVASSSAGAQSAEELTDWPMRGFDLQNTAHTPATPATRNLEVEWTVETDEAAFVIGNGQNRQSLPAIADGRVYVGGGYAGNDVAVFRCVDLRSGDVLWTYEKAAPDGVSAPRISSSPAVADGTVYFAGIDKIVALDAETGDERWKGERPKVPESSSVKRAHGEPYGTFEAPPSVYDGVVYAPFVQGDVAGTPGGVRGFDAETGEAVFEIKLGRGSSAGLAIKDGSIYYTGYYEGLKRIDVENESVVWDDRLDPYRDADCNNPPGDVPYRPPVVSPSGRTHRIHVLGQPFPNAPMNTYTWQADGMFIKRTSPQPDEKCGFNHADYWATLEQSAVADGRVLSSFILGTDAGVSAKVRGGLPPSTPWTNEYEAIPTGVSVARNVLVTTIGKSLVGLNVFTGETVFEKSLEGLDNWKDNEFLGTPIPTDNRYLIHTWGGQLVCVKGDPAESPVTSTTTTTATPTTRETTSAARTSSTPGTKAWLETESNDTGLPGFDLGTGVAGVLSGAALLGNRLRKASDEEK